MNKRQEAEKLWIQMTQLRNTELKAAAAYSQIEAKFKEIAQKLPPDPACAHACTTFMRGVEVCSDCYTADKRALSD